MADISQLGFSVDVKLAEQQINSFIKSLKGIETASDNVQDSLTKGFTEITGAIDGVVEKFKNQTMNETLNIYREIASEASSIAKKMNKSGIGKAAKEEATALSGLKEMIEVANTAISSLFGSMGKSDKARKAWMTSNKEGLASLTEELEKYIEKAKSISSVSVKTSDFKSLEKRLVLIKSLTEKYKEWQGEMKAAYEVVDNSGLRKNIVESYGKKSSGAVSNMGFTGLNIDQKDIENVKEIYTSNYQLGTDINGKIFLQYKDTLGNFKSLQSETSDKLVESFTNIQKAISGVFKNQADGKQTLNDFSILSNILNEADVKQKLNDLLTLSDVLNEISKYPDKSKEKDKYDSLSKSLKGYVESLKSLANIMNTISNGGILNFFITKDRKGEDTGDLLSSKISKIKEYAQALAGLEEEINGMFGDVPKDKLTGLDELIQKSTGLKGSTESLKDVLKVLDGMSQASKDKEKTNAPSFLQDTDFKSFRETAKQAYQGAIAIDSFSESISKANEANAKFEPPAEQMRAIQYKEKEAVNVSADAQLSVDSVTISNATDLQTKAGTAANGALSKIAAKVGNVELQGVDSVTITENFKSDIRKRAYDRVQEALFGNLGTAQVSFRIVPKKYGLTVDKENTKLAIGNALNHALDEMNANLDIPDVSTAIDVYVNEVKNIYTGEKGGKTPLTGAAISQMMQSKLNNQVKDGISVSLPLNLKLTSGKMEKNIDDIKMTIMSSFREGGSVENVTKPLEEGLTSELDNAAIKIHKAQHNALNKIASSATTAIETYIEKVENASIVAGKKIKGKIGAMLKDINANKQMKESLGFLEEIISLLNKAPEDLEKTSGDLAYFFSECRFMAQSGPDLKIFVEELKKLDEIETIKPPSIQLMSKEALKQWADDTLGGLQDAMYKEGSVTVGIIFDGDVESFVRSVTLSGMKIPVDAPNITISGTPELSMTDSEVKKMTGDIGAGISGYIQDKPVPITLTFEVDFAKSKYEEIDPGKNDFLNFVTTIKANATKGINNAGGLSLTPNIFIDAISGEKISITENLTKEIRNAVNRSIKNITTTIQSSNFVKQALNISIGPNVIKQLQLYADSMMKIASSLKTIAKAGISPQDLKMMLNVNSNVGEDGLKINRGKSGGLSPYMMQGALSSVTGDISTGIIDSLDITRNTLLKRLSLGGVKEVEGADDTFNKFLTSVSEIITKAPETLRQMVDNAKSFNEKNGNPYKKGTDQYDALEYLRTVYSKGKGEIFIKAMEEAIPVFEELSKKGRAFNTTISTTVDNIYRRAEETVSGRKDRGRTIAGRAITEGRDDAGFYESKARENERDNYRNFMAEIGIEPSAIPEQTREQLRGIQEDISVINSTKINLDISGLDTDPLKKYQNELHATQNAYAQMLHAMGVYVSARGIISFLKDATRQASNLNMEIRRIQTLAKDFDFKPLKDGLMDINSVYGRVIDNAKALYWAYSSGVRGTTKDLVKFTEEMAKTAKSINADVMSTTDAITNMMNAYGYTANEAGRLGDVLFTIIKEGKANAMQLTSALGNVISTASALGITERELGAATATLTKTMGASKALTIFNNILGKLVNPTSESAELMEQLGLDISANAIKAKGFAQVMRELRVATQGNIGIIAKLFPDLRGQRAAVALLSTQWDEFQKQLSNFDNVNGARDEALQSITNTPEAAFAAMSNTLEIIKAKAGDATTSFITLGGAITPVFTMLNGLGSGGKSALGWVTALTALGTGFSFVDKAATLLKYNMDNAAIQSNMMEVDRQRNTLVSQLSVLQGELTKKQEEAANINAKLAKAQNDEQLQNINNQIKARENELAQQRQILKNEREILKLSEQKLSVALRAEFAMGDYSRAVVDDISKAMANIKYDEETKKGTVTNDVTYSRLMDEISSKINMTSMNIGTWQKELNIENLSAFNEALANASHNLGKTMAKGYDLTDGEAIAELKTRIDESVKTMSAYVKTDNEGLKNNVLQSSIINDLLKNLRQTLIDLQKGSSIEYETYRAMKGYNLGRLNSVMSEATGVSNEAKKSFTEETAPQWYQEYKKVDVIQKELIQLNIQQYKRESELRLDSLKSMANENVRMTEAYRQAVDRYSKDVANIYENAKIQISNAQVQGGAAATKEVMANVQKAIDLKYNEMAQEIQGLNLKMPDSGKFNQMGTFKAIGNMTEGMNLPGMGYMRRVPGMGGIVRALDVGLKPLQATVSGITLGIGKLALSSSKLNPQLLGINTSANKIISTLAKSNPSMVANSFKDFSKLTDEQRKSFEDLGKTLGMTGVQAQGALRILSKVGGAIGIASAVIGIGTALYNAYKGNGGPLQEKVEGIAGVKREKGRDSVVDAQKTYYENMKSFYKEYEEIGKSIIPHLETELDLLKERKKLGQDTNEQIEDFMKRMKNLNSRIDMISKQSALATEDENIKRKTEAQQTAIKNRDIAREIQNAFRIKVNPFSDNVTYDTSESSRIAKEKLGRELTDEEKLALISRKFVKSFEDAKNEADNALKKAIDDFKASLVAGISSEKLKIDFSMIENEMMSSVMSASQKLMNKEFALKENQKTRDLIISGYKDEYDAIETLTKKYAEAQNEVELQTQKMAGIKGKDAIAEAEKELERLTKKASEAKNAMENMNESIRNNKRQNVELSMAIETLRNQVKKMDEAYIEANKQAGSIMTNRSVDDTELEILRDALRIAQENRLNAKETVLRSMTAQQQSARDLAFRDREKAKEALDADPKNKKLQDEFLKANQKYLDAQSKLAQARDSIQDKEIQSSEEYIRIIQEETKAKKALSDAEAKILDDITKRIQSSNDMLDEIRKKRLLGDEQVIRRNIPTSEYQRNLFNENNKEMGERIKLASKSMLTGDSLSDNILEAFNNNGQNYEDLVKSMNDIYSGVLKSSTKEIDKFKKESNVAKENKNKLDEFNIKMGKNPLTSPFATVKKSKPSERGESFDLLDKNEEDVFYNILDENENDIREYILIMQQKYKRNTDIKGIINASEAELKKKDKEFKELIIAPSVLERLRKKYDSLNSINYNDLMYDIEKQSSVLNQQIVSFYEKRLSDSEKSYYDFKNGNIDEKKDSQRLLQILMEKRKDIELALNKGDIPDSYRKEISRENEKLARIKKERNEYNENFRKSKINSTIDSFKGENDDILKAEIENIKKENGENDSQYEKKEQESIKIIERLKSQDFLKDELKTYDELIKKQRNDILVSLEKELEENYNNLQFYRESKVKEAISYNGKQKNIYEQLIQKYTALTEKGKDILGKDSIGRGSQSLHDPLGVDNLKLNFESFLETKNLADFPKGQWEYYLQENKKYYENILSNDAKEISDMMDRRSLAYQEIIDNSKTEITSIKERVNKLRTTFKLMNALTGSSGQQYKAYSYLLKKTIAEKGPQEQIDNLTKLRDEAFKAAKKDWIFRKGTKEQKTNLYVEYLKEERENLQKQYDDAVKKANDLLEGKNGKVDQGMANKAQEELQAAQNALIKNYNSERDAMNGLAEAQKKSAQESYELAKQLNKMASAAANANKVDTIESERMRLRTWNKAVPVMNAPKNVNMAALNEKTDNQIQEYALAVKDLSEKLGKTFMNQTGYTTTLSGKDEGTGKAFSQGVESFDTSVSNFNKAVSSFEIKAKELM